MIEQQEDVWVDIRPKLVTPTEALEIRSVAKFWTVWQQEGKRAVMCRICGETIPAGECRLGFQHLNIAARMYDRKGFVHRDERVCQQNLELDSLFDQQMVDAEMVGPEENQ